MGIGYRSHMIVVAVACGLLIYLWPSQLLDILMAARTGSAPIHWWLAALITTAGAPAAVLAVAGRTPPKPFVDGVLATFPTAVLAIFATRSDLLNLLWSLPLTLAVLAVCIDLSRRTPRGAAFLASPVASLLPVGILLVLAVIFGTSPIVIPRAFGPVPLLFLGLVSVGIIVAACVRHPRIAAMYLIVCIRAAWLFPPASVPLTAATTSGGGATEQFIAWLDERTDHAAYAASGRPYPVLLSSAEGGGIYAAAHAYNVLNALDAQCPNFAQHLFLSVGVSGGGFGQALYVADKAGTTQPEATSPCNGAFPPTPPSFAEGDYLSPLLANLLFVQLTDFLLLGLPSGGDGVSVLAGMLSEVSGGYLDRPLVATWSADSNGPAPVFVATDIHAGRRFVMAPFTQYTDTGATYFPDATQNDISMARAAALSAVFPYVTGSGRLVLSEGRRNPVLVDGGYIDNTGAQTVDEFVQTIRRFAVETQVCHASNVAIRKAAEAEGRVLGEYELSTYSIGGENEVCQCPLYVHRSFNNVVTRSGCERHVFLSYLAISAQPIPGEEEQAEEDEQPSYFSDPVDAALTAFSRASAMGLEIARLAWTDGDPARVQGETADIGLFDHVLPAAELELPLGWKLSPERANDIHRISANLDACPYETVWRPASEWFHAALDSDLSKEWTGTPEQMNGCNMKMLAWLFNPGKGLDPHSLYGIGP